jgi:hypothetical protein
MFNFISGVIVGIIVATVGFSGVARVMDKAVDKTKEIVQEQAK